MDGQSPASPAPISVSIDLPSSSTCPMPSMPLEQNSPSAICEKRRKHILQRYAGKDVLYNRLYSRYRTVRNHSGSFLNLLEKADVSDVYRNRAFLSPLETRVIVYPAIYIYTNCPSMKVCVYQYVSMLVHEHFHNHLNKVENPAISLNIRSVAAACSSFSQFLIKKQIPYATVGTLKDMVKWICTMTAELSVHNSFRPSLSKITNIDDLIEMFMACDSIRVFVDILDIAVFILLHVEPATCMNTILEATRFGVHFKWIFVYLVSTHSELIIPHLVKYSVEQYRSFAEEVYFTRQNMIPAMVVQAVHVAYQTKFILISDVFNYLMKKRPHYIHNDINAILIESFDSHIDEKTKLHENLAFTFFFKLITCSVETLRSLIEYHSDLCTPWNAIRAIRQVRTVEKSTLLATTPFLEFLKKAVEVLEIRPYGIIFELIVRIVNNNQFFKNERNQDIRQANQIILRSAAILRDQMFCRLIRVSHSISNDSCRTEYPAIRAFASGRNLHFIISNLSSKFLRSKSVVFHLHSIAISFGEMKAAEIALRMMMGINSNLPRFLHILIAYVQSVVLFYPNFMETMYKEIKTLKILIDNDLGVGTNQVTAHCNFMYNLKTLLEWDSGLDESHAIAFLRFYPGQYIGDFLVLIFEQTVTLSYTAIEEDLHDLALDVVSATTRIIEALCSLHSIKRIRPRTLLMDVSTWYKFVGIAATLLKNCLFLICEETDDGIAIFEELRTSLLTLFYNCHLDPQMKPLLSLFVYLFVHAFVSDSKRLFGEVIDEDMHTLVDENRYCEEIDVGRIEPGEPVIGTLKKLPVRYDVLELAHSGHFKRRKEEEEIPLLAPPGEDLTKEDQRHRMSVLHDALRAMCSTGTRELQLDTSKGIALALNDIICRDALSSDLKMDEWDLESEFIHRYVEADSRASNNILCDGLLRVLADTPSYAYALPVIKAQLAVIIKEAEKTSAQTKCSQFLLKRIDRWIMLASKSGLIPKRMSYLWDVSHYCNVHETFLMLLEVWKFLQGRALTVEVMDKYHEKLLTEKWDRILPNEAEGLECTDFDTFRMIIMNNWSTTYKLFPKLFPNEFLDLTYDDDEEDAVYVFN